jgi:hypothetical protein
MLRKFNLLPLLLLCCLFGCGSPDFELRFYLIFAHAGNAPITDGLVKLQFGEEVPFPSTQPDANGRVVYSRVPGKYFQDSIRLVYEPTGNRRYRVTHQSASSAAVSKVIYFTLDFPSDFTTFEWSLRDSAGNGIEGARLKAMGGKYEILTGSNGYFSMSLPVPAGDKAWLEASKDGKVLLKREEIITPEYRRLIIDPE